MDAIIHINNVTLRETLLNMASIYCGSTADDVPLFCVDVERVKHLVLGETLVTTGRF